MTGKELYDELLTIVKRSLTITKSIENFQKEELISEIIPSIDKGVDALSEDECRSLLKANIFKEIIYCIDPLDKIKNRLEGI
jgi:hypothetical protein